MKFIMMSVTTLPQRIQKELSIIVESTNYKTKEGNIFLSITEWQSIEKKILTKYRKFSNLEVGLVEIRKNKIKTIFPKTKLFSITFDEMERELNKKR